MSLNVTRARTSRLHGDGRSRRQASRRVYSGPLCLTSSIRTHGGYGTLDCSEFACLLQAGDISLYHQVPALRRGALPIVGALQRREALNLHKAQILHKAPTGPQPLIFPGFRSISSTFHAFLAMDRACKSLFCNTLHRSPENVTAPCRSWKRRQWALLSIQTLGGHV